VSVPFEDEPTRPATPLLFHTGPRCKSRSVDVSICPVDTFLTLIWQIAAPPSARASFHSHAGLPTSAFLLFSTSPSYCVCSFHPPPKVPSHSFRASVDRTFFPPNEGVSTYLSCSLQYLPFQGSSSPQLFDCSSPFSLLYWWGQSPVHRLFFRKGPSVSLASLRTVSPLAFFFPTLFPPVNFIFQRCAPHC